MKELGKIYLVGMPGSGKSYLGKPLALKLNAPFIDMDDVIESREGRSISDIFSQSGEDYFRQVESNVLHDLSEEYSNAIISTGGGAPCFHEGIDFMNDQGITVFLKTDKSILFERLARKSHRPLMQGDVVSKTEALLKKRLPIYEKAHLAISHRDVSLLIDSLLALRS
ncbi:MAG: shikimate kinase [Cyclobacteriaceae bacterium]